MIGTFFSLAIAVFLFFSPLSEKAFGDSSGLLAAILIVVASLFIIIQTLITVFAWGPLQKTEQNFTPRLMESFKRDRNLRFTNLLLLCFLLFTYLIIVDILFLHTFKQNHLLIAWTLFLGVSLDFLHHYLKRVMDYIDPFHIVEFFSKTAQECVRNEEVGELCDWIDTLAETSIKAIARNSTSLALFASDKLRLLARNYLEVAKGITYHEDEEGSTTEGAPVNHVGYTLFYLFQRLELIFEKALEQKLEPICSNIITILGKIAIYGAKYDITMASYPLHYLGKFAKRAQREGIQEVGNRATLTLLEVGKMITEEIDIQYVEIKDPFLSIINYMHEIAKDTFRKEKSINMKIVTQPFRDLKELFKNEKAASHKDAGTIIQSIDRVLDEFATLETVLQTIPPIPDLVKGKSTSEKKELQT